MEDLDYNTTPELSNISPEELLTLSIKQKHLLYLLLGNMQNKGLKNTFIVKKTQWFGLNYVLLLLIKYCNDQKNIVVICKTIDLLHIFFNECQKILKDRFMKIKDNKIYFLDDFDNQCIKSDDILHCITFCQEPDFTFKSLYIWTECMYSEMVYDPTIFTFDKSIWILSPNDKISPDIYERNDKLFI